MKIKGSESNSGYHIQEILCKDLNMTLPTLIKGDRMIKTIYRPAPMKKK